MGTTAVTDQVNPNVCFFTCVSSGMGGRGQAADSGPNADEGSSSDCLPCQQGCAYCKDDTPCVAREDGALRLAVLSFQCLCLLVVFVSMVVIYHFRRNKVSLFSPELLPPTLSLRHRNRFTLTQTCSLRSY